MAWYKQGQITLTQGSNKVIGQDTEFSGNVSAGYGLVINDSEIYEVASIEGFTELTLTKSYTGTTKTNHSNWAAFPTQGVILDLINKTNEVYEGFSVVRDGMSEIISSPAETSIKAQEATNASQVAIEKSEEVSGIQQAVATLANQARDTAGFQGSTEPTSSMSPISDSTGKIKGGWIDVESFRVKLLNKRYPDKIFPFLDLQFAGATKINDPNVQFSRTSKATYWDKDGILREADMNEPRFQYDPTTGEALGLLLEGQATNNFSGGLFGYASSDDPAIITTVEDEKLPGIQVTRIKGVADDYEGFRDYRTSSEVTTGEASAGHRRVAFLVKPSGSVRYMRTATWQNTHTTTHGYRTSVDLWDLQVNRVSYYYTDVYLQDVGDGWVFVSYTTRANSAYRWISVAFGMDGQGATDHANWTPIPEGDEVLLALPQHYSNTTQHIKTLIPTFGTPVTRSSDRFSIEGYEFQKMFNPKQGALVFHIGEKSALNNTGNTPPYFGMGLYSGYVFSGSGFYFGTRANALGTFDSFYAKRDGTTFTSRSNLGIKPGDKVGVNWKGDKLAIFVNGEKIYETTDENLPAAMSGVKGLYVHRALGIYLKNLAMFRNTLTDSQMETLTNA